MKTVGDIVRVAQRDQTQHRAFAGLLLGGAGDGSMPMLSSKRQGAVYQREARKADRMLAPDTVNEVAA
jgi:hypothetical protein